MGEQLTLVFHTCNPHQHPQDDHHLDHDATSHISWAALETLGHDHLADGATHDPAGCLGCRAHYCD